MFISVVSLYTLIYLFFFTDTATTEIYTLSLHDALPILRAAAGAGRRRGLQDHVAGDAEGLLHRKEALRLHRRRRSEEHTSELSHGYISYAVFCLKKKKKKKTKTK